MRVKPSSRGILPPPFDPSRLNVRRLAVLCVDTTGNRTMQKPPEWISVPDAAELLGCTDVWVIKMIARGDLDGFKLSARAWAVSRKSVEKNVQAYMTRDRGQAGRPRSRIDNP